MAYIPPDWSALDFSDQQSPYIPPAWADLDLSSGGASGTISATIELIADFSGKADGISGHVEAELDLAVSLYVFQDWISSLPPVQVQEVYRLVITGAADGVEDLNIGGISSWQATNQAGSRSSYLQAVMPAAEQLLPEIEARQRGELVIQKGYLLSDGDARFEEILRSRFDTLRPDRGQRALTVTVSGSIKGKAVSSGARTLTGVRSISTQNGKRRVRCNIDHFLLPGMTAIFLGEEIRTDYINYYVTGADKFCEIGER
ncbi:MAG: hypothetical protein ACTHWH_13840 [Marinobacter sp.]